MNITSRPRDRTKGEEEIELLQFSFSRKWRKLISFYNFYEYIFFYNSQEYNSECLTWPTYKPVKRSKSSQEEKKKSKKEEKKRSLEVQNVCLQIALNGWRPCCENILRYWSTIEKREKLLIERKRPNRKSS